MAALVQTFVSILWVAFAGAGLFGLALVGLIAQPVRQPPTLASVQKGALAINAAGPPAPLSRFQARDGTELAYRLYPARNGVTERVAILVHGSSGTAMAMNAVALALAEAGIVAVAIDARGHGASGGRGDIGYAGQLDDDLRDLVAELRLKYPAAPLALVGHSSGGGFVLRIAASPVGALFDRFVLVSPFLGAFAPTTRAADGVGRWAEADVPRIIGLRILESLGIDWADSLPVIGFAVAPGAEKYVTARYSQRLLTNFGPPRDWQGAFKAIAAPVALIAGENDELMDAGKYASAVGAQTEVTLVPGVDHMGAIYQPAALTAICAAVIR
jgi:pimeloyl-ACP methyl ester carboxylesterase